MSNVLLLTIVVVRSNNKTKYCYGEAKQCDLSIIVLQLLMR
jgi:hypothetical protein